MSRVPVLHVSISGSHPPVIGIRAGRYTQGGLFDALPPDEIEGRRHQNDAFIGAYKEGCSGIQARTPDVDWFLVSLSNIDPVYIVCAGIMDGGLTASKRTASKVSRDAENVTAEIGADKALARSCVHIDRIGVCVKGGERFSGVEGRFQTIDTEGCALDTVHGKGAIREGKAEVIASQVHIVDRAASQKGVAVGDTSTRLPSSNERSHPVTHKLPWRQARVHRALPKKRVHRDRLNIFLCRCIRLFALFLFSRSP